MSPETLIRAENLSRRYGARVAVAGLDLTLARGEVLGLLGPNGAGKTTTLRMLAGCLAPSTGRIRIGGHDLLRDPLAAKRQLGYLPETPPLHRELTVREYLCFCARLHGLAGRHADQAAEQALEDCGLTGVARQIIATLSQGFRQRAGLAQAIVHRPGVIILDEPTVGLDPNQIREIRGLIRGLAERHAIILSSHMLGEVQSVCDRVMIIAAGRIVFSDQLQALSTAADGAVLLLGLHRPPAPRELAALPGIESVEALAGFRFRLAITAGQDPREMLAKEAAANDWGLFELRQERRGLEEVFADLTGA